MEINFKECSLAFRHASCGLKLGNQKAQTNEVHCLAFQYNNAWYAILIILFLHLWCQFQKSLMMISTLVLETKRKRGQ